MTLSDFTSDATAQIANLKRWHALVLRIYSSDSFALLNNPMRARVKPHPLMFTMFFLDQALRLLTTGVICDLLRVFMCVCDYLVKICHERALAHNDRTPNENHHVMAAFKF